MDLTYVNPNEIKTLEDYLIALIMGAISLKTLREYHVQTMKLGIFTEDQNCRSNTMIWDFNRLMKLYNEQIQSISELLPDELNAGNVLLKLQAQELKRARKLVREGKIKEEK